MVFTEHFVYPAATSMAHIFKYYRNAFVLEQSKLNRIVSVLRERFTEPSFGQREKYEVRHADGTIKVVESLENLYQDSHNSGRKQIEVLEITFQSAVDKDFTSVVRNGEVKFSKEGDKPFVMVAVIDNADSRWAGETFAATEEQVERSFKKGFMYTLAIPTYSKAALLAVLFGITLGLATMKFIIPNRDLSENLWLTKAEVTELETTLQQSTVISPEVEADILRRQLHNIRKSLEPRSLYPKWTVLLIAVPILVVVCSFIYLVSRCYPAAVFLWGDSEEWYKSILKQRTFVWNTIIGSMAVGILSGMFLMGTEAFFK
jgi:hypothetical protein